MKIFIITDERCGGTVFTRIFSDVFNMKIIHDPQTGVKRKYPSYDKNTNLLDYFYNTLNYDVIKCCFCSFSIEEYFKLIEYCQLNKVKIIVLHRENIFDRALSISVARTLRSKNINNLRPYGYKDTDLIEPYNLNIKIYEEEIVRYKKDYDKIKLYLTKNNIIYFHFTYNECYIDSSRLLNHKKLYLWLGLDIKNIENNKNFINLLNKDYNTKEANKMILTI
jgi:hypothetical protein